MSKNPKQYPASLQIGKFPHVGSLGRAYGSKFIERAKARVSTGESTCAEYSWERAYDLGEIPSVPI